MGLGGQLLLRQHQAPAPACSPCNATGTSAATSGSSMKRGPFITYSLLIAAHIIRSYLSKSYVKRSTLVVEVLIEETDVMAPAVIAPLVRINLTVISEV